MKKPIHLPSPTMRKSDARRSRDDSGIEGKLSQTPCGDCWGTDQMKVVTAHKGIFALTTTVTGHEAHSSQTHRGVSAVMTASKLIQWLEDRAEKLRQSAPKDSGFEPHFTTIHVGVINGGTALNIISRHCGPVGTSAAFRKMIPQIVQDFEEFCQYQMVPEMQKIALEPESRPGALLMPWPSDMNPSGGRLKRN